MVAWRYSDWDGTQEIPPLDPDDVLEALTDDFLRVSLGADAAAWAGHRVTVRIGPDGRQATIVPPTAARPGPGARAHVG